MQTPLAAPASRTPRRPRLGLPAPAPSHPPNHPAQHPGLGNVSPLGPGPSRGLATIGNVAPTTTGLHPQTVNTPGINPQFYGTQRGGDTQFGVDRIRSAIGRPEVGYSPEILAKMKGDAARQAGYARQGATRSAAALTGGPNNGQYALLSQIAGVSEGDSITGANIDIMRMNEDRIRDDRRYADSLAQGLAQFGNAERGLESNEAGRRTSLEADTAQFNRSLDSSEGQANANRDFQAQQGNISNDQWGQEFAQRGQQQEFQNVMQLLNSGQINDAQMRQMIQQLLRQNGASGIGGGGASITNGIRPYRDGGTHPGGMALVGEEGPELAMLPPGTTVIPHKPSMAMMGAPPAYEYGTPNMRPLTAAQATAMGQDQYRQTQLDNAQNSLAAAHVINPNYNYGRQYGARVYMSPNQTFRDFMPKGLSEDIFYDSAQFKSTGPKGVKGTGAGSSGILSRLGEDSFSAPKLDGWGGEEMENFDKANDRHSGILQAHRMRVQGRAYANGTPNVQSLADPWEDPSAWAPEITSKIDGLTPGARVFEGDIYGEAGPSSGGGTSTIGGKTLSLMDESPAASLNGRGALRQLTRDVANGREDYSRLDPVALAIEQGQRPSREGGSIIKALGVGLPFQREQRMNEAIDLRRLLGEGGLDVRRESNDIRRDQGQQSIDLRRLLGERSADFRDTKLGYDQADDAANRETRYAENIMDLLIKGGQLDPQAMTQISDLLRKANLGAPRPPSAIEGQGDGIQPPTSGMNMRKTTPDGQNWEKVNGGWQRVR